MLFFIIQNKTQRLTDKFMKKQLSIAKVSISLVICCVVLMVALTACGGSSTTAAVSKPKPTPTATPTPKAMGKPFHGKDFTIDEPFGWTEKNASEGSSITGAGFASNTDSNVGVNIVISTAVASSNDDQNLSTIVNNEQKNLGSTRIDTSVSSTAEVANESWARLGSLATVDGTNVRIIYLAKTHAGKFCFITMYDTAQNFDQANQQFFQPMLKSFQWV